jgi:hypothetical protein
MHHFVAAFLFLSLLLSAQVIETVGGTTSAPTLTNRAKASLYRVDTTVVLLEFEMFLNVPAPDTLTFFAYRHHSRTGTSTLAWTLPVSVAGGIGPTWYSTGSIALPLIAGNHYALGVAWSGSVTYYWSSATAGSPVSFGSWQRAHTLTPPLPATLSFTGADTAQYHQRLTSIATGAVVNTGTGCSASTLVPRLVADGLFAVNTTTQLELVDTVAPAIAVFALANGGAPAVPLPLFGCSIWLDVSQGYVTLAALTAAPGYASLALPIPPNPGLNGLTFSGQALTFGNSTDVSNAVAFTIQ